MRSFNRSGLFFRHCSRNVKCVFFFVLPNHCKELFLSPVQVDCITSEPEYISFVSTLTSPADVTTETPESSNTSVAHSCKELRCYSSWLCTFWKYGRPQRNYSRDVTNLNLQNCPFHRRGKSWGGNMELCNIFVQRIAMLYFLTVYFLKVRMSAEKFFALCD